MKTRLKSTLMAAGVLILALALAGPALAATNEATDPGGGGVSLSNSGQVTVTATTLQLVKQVYDTGGNCLASSPADANCNSSATSVTVPSGTALKFLIFARNDSDIAISDVRIQDQLDDTAGAAGGFTYVGASMKYDDTELDTATIAQIYTGADGGTGQSDGVGAPDDFASMDTSVSPDNLTVGAVTGQANNSVTVPAHRTFAILFEATKN